MGLWSNSASRREAMWETFDPVFAEAVQGFVNAAEALGSGQQDLAANQVDASRQRLQLANSILGSHPVDVELKGLLGTFDAVLVRFRNSEDVNVLSDLLDRARDIVDEVTDLRELEVGR